MGALYGWPRLAELGLNRCGLRISSAAARWLSARASGRCALRGGGGGGGRVGAERGVGIEREGGSLERGRLRPAIAPLRGGVVWSDGAIGRWLDSLAPVTELTGS